MKHLVEHASPVRQTAYIASSHKTAFVVALQRYLSKYAFRITFPPLDRSAVVTYRFYLDRKNPETILNQIALPEEQCVFINRIDLHHKERRDIEHRLRSLPKKRVKTVLIIGSEAYAIKNLENIIWFITSREPENHLLLQSPSTESGTPSGSHSSIHKRSRDTLTRHIKAWSLRTAVIGILVVTCIVATLFVPPLIATSIMSWTMVKHLSKGSLSQAAQEVKSGQKTLELAQRIYKPVRPFYLFFGLSKNIDDVFFLNQQIVELIFRLEKVEKSASLFAQLATEKQKTVVEVEKMSRLHLSITNDLKSLEEQLYLIFNKIPKTLFNEGQKNQISTALATLSKVRKIMPLLPELLGQTAQRKYLVLFANNMELRPGGGFIGSFAHLTMSGFAVESLQIYDVYDADGQLKAHIPPPDPIRQYLGQPHWFLRDSAFSPDFYDNYQQALFFLEKEMPPEQFDGAILITTSAMREMIGAFNTITLPDYKETITKDNFYLKTQYYAEHNFFPGSTQKKSFLSALANHLIMQASFANPAILAEALITSLDQKQIVLYSTNTTLQNVFDSLYWSGRVAQPYCPSSKANCYSDFLFPYDANLGVNKANFSVQKSFDVSVQPLESGLVETTLEVSFRNGAVSNTFLSGAYRNYFQTLLPRDALIQQVLVDSVPYLEYDTEQGQTKKVGLFLEVAPGTERRVSIRYRNQTAYTSGRLTYQLVMQKQAGSFNFPLSLRVVLPSTYLLVNQNFSPLVNQNQIIYNTELTSDKVFFIELEKKKE